MIILTFSEYQRGVFASSVKALEVLGVAQLTGLCCSAVLLGGGGIQGGKHFKSTCCKAVEQRGPLFTFRVIAQHSSSSEVSQGGTRGIKPMDAAFPRRAGLVVEGQCSCDHTLGGCWGCKSWGEAALSHQQRFWLLLTPGSPRTSPGVRLGCCHSFQHPCMGSSSPH